MNRRSFLKSITQAAIAVAIAPPVIRDLMPMANGGIVGQLDPPFMVGETISADYFSIKWPVTVRSWETASIGTDGLHECRCYINGDTQIAVIPLDIERHILHEKVKATVAYVDKIGTEYHRHPLPLCDEG